MFGILSKIGLYAFLSLIPLIIVYLIKPRPKRMKMPSLMFFVKQNKRKHKNVFSRFLFKDYLFLIQLIILILLCASIVRPFFIVDHDITSKNTVVVFDVSASMQTYENGKMRFEIGLDKVKDALGGKNTLILAGSTPRIVLNSESSNSVKKYLAELSPTESGSNLAEAILMAGELLVGKDGRVVVVSDFVDTFNNDPFVAKSVLESKGVVVDFVRVGGEAKNVGIVTMNLDQEYGSLTIKNYNSEDAFVKVTLNENAVEMNVPAEAVKTFTFSLPPGKTEIKLLVEEGMDDFYVDNYVYVSTPNIESVNVLLVNNGVSKYLYNALNAIPKVNVELSEPPVIKEGDYDIYILQNILQSEFLIGSFEELTEKGKVIVYAQEDLVSQNYYGLLPVQIEGVVQESTSLELGTVIGLEDGVNFGGVNYYFATTPKDGTVSLLTAAGSPVIAKQNEVLYYGILDEYSDFKLSPSYPIFWSNLIEHLMEIKDLTLLNKQSGTSLFLNELLVVKTPSTTQETNKLDLDYTGFYEVNGDIIGVNLLDEQESSVTFMENKDFSKVADLKGIKEKRNFELSLILVYILLGLLVFELFYVKLRGEI